METTTNPRLDLEARMRPSDEEIAAADAVLAHTDATGVLTPIAFPGKEYGFWTTSQEVVTSAALFIEHDTGFGDDKRQDACAAAARLLDGADGTVGYVWHRGDGQWSVFEDILPASHYLG